MIITHNVVQGTPQWHALRNGNYTGQNADKLILYGTIDYCKTRSTSFKGNFYTKRGHILEDKAIHIYESIHGLTVDRPGAFENTRFKHCIYSPDGATDIFLIEVKCFNKKKHMQMFNGNVPFKVLAQIYYGLLISGKRKAVLIIYNPDFVKEDNRPDLAYKEIPVYWNRDINANLVRKLTMESAYVSYGYAAT